MKPKDAARIFNSLDDDVLLPVAQEMKSDDPGPVLAAMNPDAAQKLTVKLANKLALPDTAGAMAPAPAAGPAGSGPGPQRPAGRGSPAHSPGGGRRQPKAARPLISGFTKG